MKNFILIFVLAVVTAVTSFAQTTQGSLTFGGGLRYTTSKNDYDGDQKNTDISFQPSAGYFVADNLAIGVTLSINSNKVDYGNTDNTTNQFLAGPFARYYKFTSNEKFAFTGEAGFLFGSSKTKYSGGTEIKGNSFDFYIAPGFTYFFSEKWGLDFQLRGITYSSNNPNKDSDIKSSSFSFGLQSFSPSLGFRFYLGK
jgi:outer membrane protein